MVMGIVTENLLRHCILDERIWGLEHLIIETSMKVFYISELSKNLAKLFAREILDMLLFFCVFDRFLINLTMYKH